MVGIRYCRLRCSLLDQYGYKIKREPLCECGSKMDGEGTGLLTTARWNNTITSSVMTGAEQNVKKQ